MITQKIILNYSFRLLNESLQVLYHLVHKKQFLKNLYFNAQADYFGILSVLANL